MAEVYLGLGSNLGDREKNIALALEKLQALGLIVVKVSTAIATEPYGTLQQPYFLNAACLVRTQLKPNELLAVLKEIEKNMGRLKGERWGPRIIDLDILLYEDLVIEEKNLCIPHTDMLRRMFVLQPLAEIAPDLLHPVTGKSIKEHKENLQ